MQALVDIIERIRETAKKHQALLCCSEALTRYALIDPLLRALGWNTEDPDQVQPEFTMAGGRSDYALIVDGKPRIFVGAKALNKPEDLGQHVSYCVTSGVPYFVTTDGVRWELYDTFRPVPIAQKKLADWNILNDSPADAARSALSLWRQSTIGIKVPSPLGHSVPKTPEPPLDPKIEEKLGYFRDNEVRDLFRTVLGELMQRGIEPRPISGLWISLWYKKKRFIYMSPKRDFFIVQALSPEGKWTGHQRVKTRTEWDAISKGPIDTYTKYLESKE